MKGKIILLLAILVLSVYPPTHADVNLNQTNNEVPRPLFQGLNDTGTPENSYIYDVNTSITITYKANRYDVEGLILLGSGSNLTEDYSSDNVMHFKKGSSLKDKTTYTIELTVTNYTYFYARSWYGTVANGTNEMTESFAGQPAHQLWVNSLYPVLEVDSSTVSEKDGALYAPRYSNVTLQYRVRNTVNDPTENITIVFGNNETEVLNVSSSGFINPTVNVTRTNYLLVGNYNFSIFEYKFNFTQPMLYFSAYNTQGWERDKSLQVVDTPVVHRLTNGFNMSRVYNDGGKFTNVQKISFNITTFNQTDEMEVGFQWRYFQNSSAEEPVQDWAYTYNLTKDSSELVDEFRDGNVYVNSTIKTQYTALINQTFINDTVVQMKYFVTWDNNRYNWTGGLNQIPIYSGITPIELFDTVNNTIWNATTSQNQLIQFSFSTPKEDITEAKLYHNRPQGEPQIEVDILNKENYTIDFTYDANDIPIEGMHEIFINVTNTLNITNFKRLVYYIDTTNPTGNISLTSNALTTDGKVTVSYNYADDGLYDKGIDIVQIDWGNGIVVNATGKSQMSFTYQKSGTYDINLIVIDKAGNSIVVGVGQSVTVNLPEPQESTTKTSPFFFAPVLISLGVILAVRLVDKKNQHYKVN